MLLEFALVVYNNTVEGCIAARFTPRPDAHLIYKTTADTSDLRICHYANQRFLLYI